MEQKQSSKQVASMTYTLEKNFFSAAAFERLCLDSDRLTLIWVRGGGGGSSSPLPCWFSLNNSKTVKVVNLAFYSIQ